MATITQASALAAVGLAGLFEGGGAYCLVSHPVPFYYRKEEDPLELLREFRRLLPNAIKFQGGLAALGGIASATAALTTSDKDVATAFGVVAACEVALWAFTMAMIMPLNRKLMAKGGVEGEPPSKAKAEEVRGLLQHWARLHAVRVALGGVALGASLYGLNLMLK